MALTEYRYTIASDDLFPNKKVDLPRFESEIRASAILTALDSVVVATGDCVVTMKSSLSGGDQLILDGLVAAHSGSPLLPDIQPVEMYSGTTPAPLAADGKPFVLPNSFPGEVLLNFTGVSDKISPAERFAGDDFGLQVVGAAGDATFIVDFLDGVFLAGGHIEWDGGSYGSTVYMELTAPASTTKAPAVAGQGNCNKVQVAAGAYIIVPAAGNGQYDLDTVVPIPAYNDETNAQTGYWTYSEPWVGKGTITPGSPGASKYNLFDFPIEMAHFAKIHLMRDSGARDMIAPAIKPKWILPEWKMKVILHNGDTNKTIRLAWDLLVARRKSA